jgi:hypothetical protein
MVTQWILNKLAEMVATFVGLFPSLELPSWYSTVTSFWAETNQTIESFAYWIPLSAIGNACALIFTASLIHIAIKIGRIALSFATLGGGSSS